MNQLSCDIVRDLLPLYHDGVCSGESRSAVEAHLATCSACRAELAGMDTAFTAPVPAETEPLKAAGSAWKRARRRAFRKGFSIAGGIVLALVLIFGVLSCFYFLDRMVGVSMEPTLSSGELCLFRRSEAAERGDIIAASLDWMSEYGIKDIVRVAALPGDTVEIRDGSLYLNGEISGLCPAGELDPGDTAYPMTLGEEEYFVLGDNPGNSLDSRFQRYGPLPAACIVGQLVCTLPNLRIADWLSDAARAINDPFARSAAAEPVR